MTTEQFSWNTGNVCDWVMNDEGLYLLVRMTKRTSGTQRRAVDDLYRIMQGQRTPDGAAFTRVALREAVRLV